MIFQNPEVKMGSLDISEYEISVNDSKRIRKFSKQLTCLSAINNCLQNITAA
ncbi:MAG: hypothetical protein NT175_10100 [Bacteroidetes bacterium]|nr:hypothetical protein [Bacteroidota bacterium]